MRRFLCLILVVGVICALSGCFGGGMVPQEKASVSGTVTNKHTLDPVEGATVTIGSHVDTTDFSGSYTISNINTGTYTISAIAAGYRAFSQTVDLVPGSQAINIQLEPTPVVVDGCAYLPESQTDLKSPIVDPTYGRTPLSHATVEAYSFTTGLKVAGPEETDENGHFALEVPGGVDVVIVCTKGNIRLSRVCPSASPVDSIEVNMLTALTAEAYSAGLFGSGSRVNRDDLNALLAYIAELLLTQDLGTLDLQVGGELLRPQFGQGLFSTSPIGKSITDYVDLFEDTSVRLVRGTIRELRRVAFLSGDTAYSEYMALQQIVSEGVAPNFGNLGSQMEFVACVADNYNSEIHSSGYWLVDTQAWVLYPDESVPRSRDSSVTVEDESVFSGVPSGPYSETVMTLELSGEETLDSSDVPLDCAVELSLHLENSDSGASYDGLLQIAVDSLDDQTYYGDFLEGLTRDVGTQIGMESFLFSFQGSMLDPGMAEPLEVGLLVQFENLDPSTDQLILSGELAGPGFGFLGELSILAGHEIRTASNCVITPVSVWMSGSATVDEWGTVIADSPGDSVSLSFCIAETQDGSTTVLESYASRSTFSSSRSLTEWCGTFQIERSGRNNLSVAEAIAAANPLDLDDVNRSVNGLLGSASFQGEVTFRDGSTMSAGVGISAEAIDECEISLFYSTGSHDIDGTIVMSVTEEAITTRVDFESSKGISLTATVENDYEGLRVDGTVTDSEGRRLALIRETGGSAQIIYEDGEVESLF